VTVRRGLTATDGLVLRTGRSCELTVPPVPPRIYFPAFSSEQFAGGNRLFTIQSVNVAQFTLRAKLLDAANIVHALRGYQSYYDGPRYRRNGFGDDADDNERYRRVDYNVMAGRTMFQENLVVPGVPDEGWNPDWGRKPSCK
jgi:hypothetical protein